LPRLHSAVPERVLTVRDLRAYYRTKYFGISREVRAVDGVSLHVDRNEIYGLAGESSCGKTTLIKTIVRAIRPPLDVVGGSVTFHFAGRDRDILALSQRELEGIRWRHLSYILQGSMNVLNPVRRVRQSFVDFAHRHIGKPMPEFLRQVEGPPCPRAPRAGRARCLSARTVGRDAAACHDRARHRLPARFHHRGRADDRARRGGAEGRARHAARGQQEIRSSMILVTHDIGVHANVTDRLGIMYAGRLVEEGRTVDVIAIPATPTRRIWSRACRGSAT
jgi:peptide/nickel transport system ATP-binding protein